MLGVVTEAVENFYIAFVIQCNFFFKKNFSFCATTMSDINLDEVPPGVVNPLDHVNDEQKAKMQKLRDISNTWNLAQPEKDFIDEMCLFRFI